MPCRASQKKGSWTDRACHVGGAVEVLCPGVEKKHVVEREGRGGGVLGLVVDDGAVRTHARDRRKAAHTGKKHNL